MKAIRFEQLKARLLANPKVKAEYDALGPEFESAAELAKARQAARRMGGKVKAHKGTLTRSGEAVDRNGCKSFRTTRGVKGETATRRRRRP